MTANIAVDIARRERRMLPVGLGREAQPEATEAQDPLSLIDLAAALAALPKRQREVIVLQYLEGLSEAEIAATLGVSPGTIKKNGFRARETLRKRLGADIGNV